MKEVHFTVGTEYIIAPEKNLVNHIHIEPRLMKLLCLLMENRKKLVSREHIIETIWNGYGGGGEGLTQGISLLRKIFKDGDKKIIETIPKSGYIFNAPVEKIDTAPKLSVNKFWLERRTYVWSIAITGIAITAFAISGFRKTPALEVKKSFNYKNVNHDSLHKQKHMQ